MIRRHRYRHRRFARGLIGLTSGAIVVVCVAVAVPAFGFASRSTHSVVVPQLAVRSTTAKCPKGEHVAFGGVTGEFKPPPKTLEHPIVFPTSMHRTAAGNWTVTGKSEATGTGSRLTALAYCARGTVPRVATKTVSMPGLQAAVAIATCPTGTVVVGGGYSSAASPTHLEYLGEFMRESPTKLVVTMVNLSKTATTVTGIAYCAKGAAPKEYRAIVALSGKKGGAAHASCPARTSLVFGGLDTSVPTGTVTHFSAVTPFSLTAESTTGWAVTGYDVGDVKGSLTAIAYCR